MFNLVKPPRNFQSRQYTGYVLEGVSGHRYVGISRTVEKRLHNHARLITHVDWASCGGVKRVLELQCFSEHTTVKEVREWERATIYELSQNTKHPLLNGYKVSYKQNQRQPICFTAQTDLWRQVQERVEDLGMKLCTFVEKALERELQRTTTDRG